MANQQEDPPKRAEELRLLYSISIEDIRYSKNRQWAITYYGLVGYAGIIGFYSLIQQRFGYLCLSQKLFYSLPLVLPAFLLTVFCLWHIMDIHFRLIRYRWKLQAIEGTFEATPKQIAESGPGYLEIGRYYWPYPGVFLALVPFGFLYVAWILYGSYISLLWIVILVSLFEVPFLSFAYLRHKKKLEEFKRGMDSPMTGENAMDTSNK